MNRKETFLALVAMGILLITGSCHKMILDSELMTEITQVEFPIDTIDGSHDWNLVKRQIVNVVARVPGDNIVKAQVLSGNPYETANTEILAEKLVQGGPYMSLYTEMPLTQTDLWVAAVSSSGKYYVLPYPGSGEVRFDGAGVISSGTLQRPVPQAFTYLFEENFPLTGDFDFNDVVLRISREFVSANTLKLHVTLAAVGASKMIGAAIRLPSIDYEDVEDITIDEGERFDENYPVRRYFIDNEAIYTRGIDGTAVINLFDDAHWVLNPEAKNGRIMRLYYNTTGERENVSAIVPTQSRTYTIVVKEGTDISQIALSTIDPFIIENSNSTNMEVHTYKYKLTQALWRYYYGTIAANRMTWALLLPTSTFQYPVEGMVIGRYRDGEDVGAYSRYGHSFGQWGRNKNTSQDWWLYPASSLVYQSPTTVSLP